MYKKMFGNWVTAAAVFLAMAGLVAAQEAPAPEATVGDVYTLDTCPVSGQKLGSMGEPIVKTYDGREVRFCCPGCPPKFEADPAKYTAQIDAALIAQQKPYYPLDTCVVSGEKLGGMGEAVDYVYRNRLVRFCCSGCVKKFEADPAKYMAELDKAVIEKQREAYPVDYCVVSGDKLGGAMGEPVDYVVGNRLVRFCCSGCIKDFNKTPAKYLSMLDQAAAGETVAPPEGSHAEPGSHTH